MKLMLFVVAGALAIAAGAQLAIPMVPVPTTGQTLAVIIVGLLAGPRLGAAAAVLYLVMVLAGLPVLASGERLGGTAFFQAATAGYVVGFIPATAAVGAIGWRHGFVRACLAALVGHAVVLACGVPVLALKIGWGGAFAHGLLPFLVGAVVKSLVGAGIATLIRRRFPGR